jgi:DNA-binding NtrC family response regulator
MRVTNAGDAYGDDVPTAAVEPRPHAADRALSLSIIGPGVLMTHVLPASGELVLGRGQKADVQIEDPSISRMHARLHVGPELAIEDLGSQNGTRVQNRALGSGERQRIAIGETVEVGSVTVVVLEGHRAASARPRRLWSHDYFEARLEDECARADKKDGRFAVARFGVSGPISPGEVQEVFSKELGPEHPFAAYGPGEYEVLFVDVSPDQAVERADAITLLLEEQGARVRRGLSTYPRDGRTPETLVANACSLVRGGARADAGAVEPIVRDPAMIQLHRLAERIAVGNISVLLLGETGSGKEIFSEIIHRASPRSRQPLLRLNCAALSETLIESELFGHEKGAFSGAIAAKPGLLETADGGTVFLDEVGEMPLSLQAKLLRVIEEKKVTRVGGLKAKPIDVRFIAATNRDLEEEIGCGRFRQDLFYRLNGITLVIPPLRDRPTEIEDLAKMFIARATRELGRDRLPELSAEGRALLGRYVWPGNIRELKNVIERAVLLAGDDGVIRLEHLPVEKLSTAFAPGASREVTSSPAIAGGDDAERRRVIEALEQCGGNQTQAAKMLGMSRGTLLVRLNAFGLPRPRKRSRG